MLQTLVWIRFVAIAGVALALGACSTAAITSDVALVPNPIARPTVIYVAQFDLPNAAIQSESPMARHPLHAWREQSHAHALVADMEQDIVTDLGKKGWSAQRLAPGQPLPREGWIVRGTFLKLDEGDRVRRAVVGFGKGQTDLRIAVAVDNLSTDAPPAPLYRMQTGARSGTSPGAVVTLNPYAAAAKFVLAGHDLGRNVQATASQIAERVAAHVTDAGHAAHAL